MLKFAKGILASGVFSEILFAGVGSRSKLLQNFRERAQKKHPGANLPSCSANHGHFLKVRNLAATCCASKPRLEGNPS